jgi:predicted ATP-grasp superfamily ATP-dependent carboligase
MYAAGKPMPAAVVADVNWVNGVAAIRSLGRAGVPVIALDHRGSALGFRSRYCRALRCPHPVDDERGFVALLRELSDVLGRPAPVFATHDDYLNVICRHLGSLEGRYLVPCPPWIELERIQSKRYQLERAREAGVPVPRTAGEPTEELGFPVLVKPSSPSGFRRAFQRQAFRCSTANELEEAFERARPYDPLVQEWIPGGDEELYTLGSYIASDGEALGVFCGRKLRQTPPGVGVCRVGEARWVDEVAELGLRFLHALRFTGISQVEFKRDPRDGRFKLMEINPRLWQWHSLATACGVDVPRIAYWDLLGARLPPARQNGRGKRWAITLMRDSTPAFQRPPYVDALAAGDDPLPALVQLARVAAGAFR